MKLLLFAFVLFCIWLWFRHRHLQKNRYIGFGWMLDWVDGKVIVLTRLLDSPAGRAEVPIGSVLLKYEHTMLTFLTGDEWSKFMDKLPKPERGDKMHFRIKTPEGEIRRIELIAEVIQGPIPLFPPLTPDSARRFDIVYGVRRCPKTGATYEVRRPNKAWKALRSM